MQSEYEYSAVENSIIGSLSLWGRLLGIAFFLQALFESIRTLPLLFIGALLPGGVGVLYILYYASIGMALYKSSGWFKRVVSTEGNDVFNMLQGLGELGKAFRLRVLATVGLFLLVVVAAVLLSILGVLTL